MFSYKKCLRHLLFFLFIYVFSVYQSYSQINNTEWADSCVSSSFVSDLFIDKEYSFSGFRKVHDYIDGDVIATGTVRPNLPTTTGYKVFGLIMRISKTGVVKWSKFVGLRDYQYESRTDFYASAVTKNSDIVAVSETDVYRFDSNGNLLWQKILPVFSTSTIYEQIIETADNSLLLGGPNSFNAVVTKLEQNGTMQWAKLFSLDSYLNCRSLVEAESNYYFTGFSYNDQDKYSQSVLVKLNKQNGDIIWSKSIGKALYSQGSAEYAYDYLQYHGGKLTITGNTGNNYRGQNKAAQTFATFDTEGKLLESKRIVNPEIAVQVSSLFRSKLFDITTRTGMQYSATQDNELYLYRLDNQDKVEWAYKFVLPYRQEFVDMLSLADSSVVLAGKTIRHFSTFLESAMLIKTTKAGMLNNCMNIPAKLDVVSIPVDVAPCTINSDNRTFNNAVRQMQVFDGLGYEWKLLCKSESSCKLGTIEGPKTICAGTKSSYKVNRDGVCRNTVTYKSSVPGISIQQVSDTSVDVTFNSSGRIVLYASMPSTCGVLKDSIVINSLASPGAVDLGKDSSICEGNNIILNAKSGYVNYIWNNGLADSIINVSTLGKYFVSVLDACGKSFSDTIVITREVVSKIDLGADRIKCNNDTLVIDAPAGYINYAWSPNYRISSLTAPTVAVNPTVDTSYILKAEKKQGCFVYDTLSVTVKKSPAINLGVDTSLCAGTSIVLNGDNSFQTFNWSTGETKQNIRVDAVGTYTLSATFSNGCISKDTIKINTVYRNPMINLGKDSTICYNGTRSLSVANAYASYLWNNGSTSNTIEVKTLGIYSVKVIDNNGCIGTDSLLINKVLSTPAHFLPSDTTICSYGSIEIKPNSTFKSYLWSTNSTAPSISTSIKGVYWLQVKDNNNCTGLDSIAISMKECTAGLFAPTGFTPNRDGKNDSFRPLIYGNVGEYELIIVNRWGQTIFRTNDPGKSWDGTLNGVEQQTGVFIWQCHYKLQGQPKKLEKGTVLLIK